MSKNNFEAFHFEKKENIQFGEKITTKLDSYKPLEFHAETSANVTTTIKEKKQNFILDALVSKHLGLELAEKEKIETQINHEIERRWEITKEKAEVEGFTKGLADGKKEAYEAELPRIKEKLDHLEALLKEIDKTRFKIFEENEKFLMDILAHALRMVALKEVSTDQDYLRRLVLSLLEQIGTVDAVKITISDKDMDKINILKEAIQKDFAQLSHTVIEHRPDISESSCIVETKFNVIHASLDKQITNVMNSITEKK